jgi:hypothetical protein
MLLVDGDTVASSDGVLVPDGSMVTLMLMLVRYLLMP